MTTTNTASTIVKQSIEINKSKNLLIGGLIILNIITGISALVLILKPEIVHTYLIQSDSNGFISEPTYIGDKEGIYQQEAVSRNMVYNYVLNRENYNYYTILKQYDYVFAYSNPTEQINYNKIFNTENGGIIGQLKDDYEVSTEITSLLITESDDRLDISKYPHYSSDLTIRKSIKNKKTNEVNYKNYRVKLVFFYDLDKVLTRKERLLNPLAFTITSYTAIEYETK